MLFAFLLEIERMYLCFLLFQNINSSKLYCSFRSLWLKYYYNQRERVSLHTTLICRQILILIATRSECLLNRSLRPSINFARSTLSARDNNVDINDRSGIANTRSFRCLSGTEELQLHVIIWQTGWMLMGGRRERRVGRRKGARVKAGAGSSVGEISTISF